jgi:RNA polymerase sigma-70 factor (ECF subfamily)
MPETSHPDDSTLIRAAQHGDLGAFVELVERHHASVRACLAVRMNHAPDAEDLAQEALLIAFRRLPELDPTVPLGAWLRSVALNLLANHRRKFRALPIGLNDELQALIDQQMESQTHEARESERMHALRECLDNLDGPARRLVNERYAEGATLDDLALRLGRKSSAVSMQLHRLRGLLSTCIDGKLAATCP